MKNLLNNIISVFIIIIMFTLISCSKNPANNKTDNTSDEQTVSPGGGTYTFDDGISLIVPDGAVPSDTTISIHKLQTSNISYVADSGLTEWTAMAAFEGLPEGITFAKPVTLILPVEAITDETIVPFHIKMNSNDNGFAFVPGPISYKHGETSINMQIDGFSDHGVVGINPEAEIDAILTDAGVSSGGVLSTEDENKIISIMDCWIRSAVSGSITDGMGYADIQKVIDEYIRWRSALDELSAVIPNIDSQLGEQDTNTRELCSQAIGSAQNNAVSACACGNDMSGNYSTLLAVQADIDRLGWNELNDFIMTQDNLTLACGSLEIDPSTTDVGIGESKTLSVKVKDATGAVSDMSGLSGLTWTNGDSSKIELTPGDMSASAKGIDKGNVIVSVSYQLVGYNIPEGCGLMSADSTVNVKDSTSPVPGNGGTYTITYVSGHTLSLNWTAATDDKTQQADLEYKAVYSTTADIGTVADAEANGTVRQDWTANITSVNVTASTYNQNTYYAVLVKDEAGNKAIYGQRVVPIVEIAGMPVDGIYTHGSNTKVFGPGNNFSQSSYLGSYSYNLSEDTISYNYGGPNGQTYYYLPGVFVESSSMYLEGPNVVWDISSSFNLGFFIGNYNSYWSWDVTGDTPVNGTMNSIFKIFVDGTFNSSFSLDDSVNGHSENTNTGTWLDNNDNTITFTFDSGTPSPYTKKCAWVYDGSNWLFIMQADYFYTRQ